MKRIFSYVLMTVMCASPMMTGAQEVTAKAQEVTAKAPSSAPASAPSIEVVVTEQSEERTPIIAFVMGVYPNKRAKKNFTIGVTATGEAWKLIGDEPVGGPFASLEDLLSKERIKRKGVYLIRTVIAEEPEKTAAKEPPRP